MLKEILLASLVLIATGETRTPEQIYSAVLAEYLSTLDDPAARRGLGGTILFEAGRLRFLEKQCGPRPAPGRSAESLIALSSIHLRIRKAKVREHIAAVANELTSAFGAQPAAVAKAACERYLNPPPPLTECFEQDGKVKCVDGL